MVKTSLLIGLVVFVGTVLVVAALAAQAAILP
jgi:hypothetical protein